MGPSFIWQLRNGLFKHGERLLDASYLTSSWAVYNLVDLADSERILVNDWVKAAFDSGSVGIDDNILRFGALPPSRLYASCFDIGCMQIDKPTSASQTVRHAIH